jgi:hypothetical protein
MNGGWYRGQRGWDGMEWDKISLVKRNTSSKRKMMKIHGVWSG